MKKPYLFTIYLRYAHWLPVWIVMLLMAGLPATSYSAAGKPVFQVQDQPVSGIVSDEKGDALPGVSVTIKGTNQGTTTDAQGAFKMNVSNGSAVLVFSFVGYEKQEITVGNQSVITVRLTAGDQTLNEVVVTALGIKREKKALTYAAGELKGTDLANANVTNLGTALSGKEQIWPMQT